MKIAIATIEPDLNSEVSPVFGRAPYFLIFDLRTNDLKSIPNPALKARKGAGILASQLMVSEKVEAVISGNFGPNAFAVLQMAKIKLFPVFGVKAKEAIEKYKNNELEEIKRPPGAGFFGRGPFGRRRRGQR